MTAFRVWLTTAAGLAEPDIATTQLDTAFEVMVSRCAEARRHGSIDPLVAASPRLAGGNSRVVTRRMLSQLGYTRGQLRVVHRLLAGSTGGFPGLIRLYLLDQPVDRRLLRYIRRQLHLCAALARATDGYQVDGTGARTRRGAKQGCVAKAGMP